MQCRDMDCTRGWTGCPMNYQNCNLLCISFYNMVISSVGDLGFCEFYSFLSISYKCVNWSLELQFTIFIRMLNFCAAAYILKVCSESFEL